MKDSTKKETGRYVFPNFMAKVMSKVTIRTQYESAMLSMTFIMIGLIIYTIYMVFFSPASLFVKIVLGINMIAGFFLLSSYLVTSFQQYRNYLTAMGIVEDQTKLEEVN